MLRLCDQWSYRTRAITVELAARHKRLIDRWIDLQTRAGNIVDVQAIIAQLYTHMRRNLYAHVDTEFRHDNELAVLVTAHVGDKTCSIGGQSIQPPG